MGSRGKVSSRYGLGWGHLEFQGRQPNILQEVRVKTMPNNKCCEPHFNHQCEYITPRNLVY